MKISGLTVLLIILSIMTVSSVVNNIIVTDNSHKTADKLYEMYIEYNGSQEGRQILSNAYDSIKNIELNQKTNTSVSHTRAIILLIFTLFSYKFDYYLGDKK